MVRALLEPPDGMRTWEGMPRLPAPIATAVLSVLVAIAIGFWGARGGGADGGAIAQISRTRAELSDGECEFAADVRLASRWGSFAFSMRQQTIRRSLIDLLRSKSAYMVDSAPAREALRFQMLSVVNDAIGSGRATDLRFTVFELL